MTSLILRLPNKGDAIRRVPVNPRAFKFSSTVLGRVIIDNCYGVLGNAEYPNGCRSRSGLFPVCGTKSTPPFPCNKLNFISPDPGMGLEKILVSASERKIPQPPKNLGHYDFLESPTPTRFELPCLENTGEA